MWLKIQDNVREWRTTTFTAAIFLDYGPAGDQNRKPEMTQKRLSPAIFIGPYDPRKIVIG